MKILAIETSCDETAIATLYNLKVLSNVVLSQIKTHAPFGGVVPNLAKREHQKNLPIVFKKALKESGISMLQIDAIAVTYGPGLEPALWMGINFAIELSKKWKKPLIPVNHLEGHIYASWLSDTNPRIHTNAANNQAPKFPLLALIVSGGHTELVLMKKHLDYKILGETLDDAAGEAFDKVARLLKLGYPGGPAISKIADEIKNKKLKTKNNKSGIKFPRPMINSPNLNFSFSGLKTAVLYYLLDHLEAKKSAVAAEFQQAVIDVLVHKTQKAIKKYKPKSLIVGGGVAANKKLRATISQLISAEFPSVSLFLSPLWLTGDNAAMIAAAAHFKARAKKFVNPETLKAQGNLKLN